MSIEFLRDLLRSDSIFIGSAMTFDNLALLSKFIGKLGNQSKGGLPLEEFRKRQRLHHEAEVLASLDVCEFIRKAHTIYGYDHFVNDSSGSICELGDERVFQHLAQHTVIIYLEASKALEHEVVERQEKYPKPLYYEPQFLDRKLAEYLQVMDLTSPDQINPNEFTCWIFPDLMTYRRPKYEYIASKYGYSIPADGVESVRDEQDFIDFVCIALDS